MTDHEPTPGALQAARSLHSIEVELPDGWKVQRIITELGLRRIAAILDAFAAAAVAAERERCAKIAEAWQKANNRRYGDDIGENIAALIRHGGGEREP